MRTWGGGMLTRGETSGARVDPQEPTAAAQGALDAWGLMNAAIASFEVSTKIFVGPMRSGQGQGTTLHCPQTALSGLPFGLPGYPKNCSQRTQDTLTAEQEQLKSPIMLFLEFLISG